MSMNDSGDTGEREEVVRTGNLASLEGARILFLLNTLSLGGAERQAFNLARQLNREYGARVEICGLYPGSGFGELCDEAGIRWRVRRLDVARNRREWMLALLKYALVLRKARPDAILGYTMLPNIIGGLFWRVSGARTFVWGQRNVGQELHWFPKLRPSAITNTPLFVANSRAGARFLTDSLAARSDRVHVIHNGVDMPPPRDTRSTWRKRLKISSDGFVACKIAHFHAHKDHETLLRAWALVDAQAKREGREVHLLLAGAYLDRGHALAALARDLGIARSTHFLGRVGDVSGLLKAADIGLFSTVSEGFPNGVLECMASELAVVATDIPPIREALGDEARELLCPQGDHLAMADRIRRMICNPSYRTCWGKRNRDRVARNFSISKMSASTANLLVRSGWPR